VLSLENTENHIVVDVYYYSFEDRENDCCYMLSSFILLAGFLVPFIPSVICCFNSNLVYYFVFTEEQAIS
jgi:TRAP-type mannitol/chloroaromatic compound transport system permease small subunit